MRKLGSVVIVLGLGLTLTGACSKKDGDSGRDGTGATGGAPASGAGGTGATPSGGSPSGGAPTGGMADAGGMAGAGIGVDFPEGCALYGDPCVGGTDCCSGVCADHTCVSTVIACGEAGHPCARSTDCCSLSCVDSVCADACTADGEACEANEECCGGTCTDGLCVPLNTACLTAGNPCAAGRDCCSGLCGDDGTCTRAASFCVQNGDICRDSAECCSADCLLGPDGVGTCTPVSIGAANCSGLEGMLCSDCNSCCSRVCAPYAATGMLVCQPARGCRVMGDLCRQDNDCCGVDGTGLPGEGNVFCLKNDPDDAVGICRSPLGCNPQGNVCHFQDYVCSNSSSRNNCCGATGESGTCQPNAAGVLVCGGTGFLCQPDAVEGDGCEPCLLDPFGVPRCNALGECRIVGETCATSADCCDEMPCVPDDEGVLRCGATTCIPVSGPCTVDADCCFGLPCVRPVGSTHGTCGGDIGTGGAGGGGGATGSGGTTSDCALYGQQCSTTEDCCNEVPCTDGVCLFPIG